MTDTIVYDRREPVLSWAAIVAGSLVALATSAFLTLLAAGFGYDLASGVLETRRSLAAFSPYLGAGAVAIQVISAALGGYLAGRLRHAWTTAHLDEAHFRDTAQGIVVWALATVAGLLLSALVIAPYAADLAPPAAVAAGAAPTTAADAARAAHIAAQAAFFTAIGMIASAFVAAVAARVGGLQTEHMLVKRVEVAVS
jgi:hypothetical protein